VVFCSTCRSFGSILRKKVTTFELKRRNCSNMWLLWLILKAILFLVVCTLLLMLKHLTVSILRYTHQKSLLKKIAPDIPRQKTLFPIFGLTGADSYNYETLLEETFDEKGIPLKILNQGPHLDGSTIIAFSSNFPFEAKNLQTLMFTKKFWEILKSTTKLQRHTSLSPCF
jgi:hypothetical protein